MKITANRRDDILRKKAEYDAKMEAYNKDRDERRSRMYQAEHAITNPVKEKLEQDLARFNLLKFRVSAGKGYNWGRGSRDHDYYIELNIKCNDHWDRDDNSALSWNFDVKLDDDGNVVKETGSWSGLQATTREQLDSLRQTVEAIELLNSYDWKSIIDVDFPSYDEFYKDAPDQPERFDATVELTEATIEDLIGKDAVVKIKGWGEEYTARYYWAHIIGQTEKQWRMHVLSGYVVDALIRDTFDSPEDRQRYVDAFTRAVSDKGWAVRARKSSIRLTDVENPEIVTFDQLKLV